MKSILPICIYVAFLAAGMLIEGCIKSSKSTDAPKINVSSSATKQDIPIKDQMTTVYRAHLHSDKICYDSNNAGFFIHWRDLDKDEDPTIRMYGWYILSKVEFFQSANGKWFIGEQDDKHYFKSYPDVSGLPCQELHE